MMVFPITVQKDPIPLLETHKGKLSAINRELKDLITRLTEFEKAVEDRESKLIVLEEVTSNYHQ